MLALARTTLPDGHFGLAAMTALPLADGSVDLVVNALAMTHVEDLGHVFAEAARVLRPGDHLLVSDVHGYYSGSDRSARRGDPTGEIGCLPSWSHPTRGYLGAAIPTGFLMRDCREVAVHRRTSGSSSVGAGCGPRGAREPDRVDFPSSDLGEP